MRTTQQVLLVILSGILAVLAAFGATRCQEHVQTNVERMITP